MIFRCRSGAGVMIPHSDCYVTAGGRGEGRPVPFSPGGPNIRPFRTAWSDVLRPVHQTEPPFVATRLGRRAKGFIADLQIWVGYNSDWRNSKRQRQPECCCSTKPNCATLTESTASALQRRSHDEQSQAQFRQLLQFRVAGAAVALSIMPKNPLPLERRLSGRTGSASHTSASAGR